MQGGIGLKDLILHGISLASKWIAKALVGNEPWKVPTRNNIQISTPKQAKAWKMLPISDILNSKLPMVLVGSLVFKILWKNWELVKHSMMISNGKISSYNNNGCQAYSSIWWNLEHKSKPIALLQGCSTNK